MKKFTIITLLLTAILFCGVQRMGYGQLLLVDDFTGLTVGTNLAGQSGWTKFGSGPDPTIGNTTPLSYINYNGGGGEYVVMPAPSATSSKVSKALTTSPAPGTNTFFYSILIRLVSTSSSSSNYFVTLGDPGSGTTYFARLFAQTNGAGYNIGISKLSNTAVYGSSVLNLNQTYLIVVRYDFITGASNDALYIWVNPLLTSEPSTSMAEASITTLSDATPATVGNFHWHNRGLTNPVGSFDAIRVAYGATSAAAWTNLDGYFPSGTPTISVNPAALNGFNYLVGTGPSTSQSYDLSGSNLTPASGNLTITPSTDYEISLDNTTFSSTSLTKAYTGGALASTPVYVRLKAGLPLGNYNSENVANLGGGATAVNVVCSGSVVKPEPTNHATTFAAVTGTPSYSVINTTWTDAIGATTPEGYLVKGATGGYGSIVDPVDGTPETDAPLVKNVAQGVQAKVFTDLIDNTQYYFKIFPYSNSGGFINYKTNGTVPTATATTTLSPSVTYTWQGADGAPWNVSTNWTPTRTTPAINDILIFNGGGIKTVTAVPTQTVAKIIISGNTTINLQSSAAVTLSLMGGTGADLDIPSGCALNLNAPNVITIALLTTATASISGSMSFSSTLATAHRLTGADASSIVFNIGATFSAGLNFSGNAFGNVKANSVIFTSGTTYIHQAGSNPFVNIFPNSIVLFQTGSLYKLISNATPSFSGKTYANFEMDATGATVSTSGASPVSIDNLTITNGTLNFGMTANPGHSIKGNITVATGGILNFTPASAGTVRLNGSAAQYISGDGIITTGANSTLEILNAAGVDLGASITMNGKLKLTSGLLDLGSKNLLLGSTSTIEGTPSATNMVIATGNGQLQKSFAAAGSFVYPIGDSTVVAEYSPVTLTFTSGTFATGNFVGVNLVNAKFPDDPNTGSYLNRYWNLMQTGITGFTCNAAFQYLLADIVGTESQIYCLKVLPTPFVTYDIANTTLQLLTASGLTEFGTFTGSQPLSPNVTTNTTLIDLTHNSVTGGGNVASDGGSPITARGLCYATTHNPTLASPHTSETGSTGLFTSAITGLVPQTTYYFRAYATNMVGTGYGSEVSFTTLCEPLPPVVNFIGDTLTIFMGESVDFFDASLYCPTYWKWSFVGGSPYESYDKNPADIVYNLPGLFTVCLDASNAFGFASSCKEAYIRVLGPTNAKIVMTEIMYNPPELGTDTLEFIELYNNDVIAWNLKDFYFEQGVTYVFPDVSVNPGAYLLVAKNAAAMQHAFGVSALQWTDGSLNNNGEPIIIYDNYGYMVDSVYYGVTPPWDTLANGFGSSLELCNPNLDNNDPLNWRHAIEFQAVNASGDTIWASPLAGCSYAPVAVFTANKTIILEHEYVTFTDASTTNTANWEWTFEGGTPATYSGKTPPPVQYNTMGLFDVSLRVSNIAGHNTMVKSNYINVGTTGVPGKDAAGFAVYPNPSNGQFTLCLNEDQASFVKILDQLGKVVYQEEVNQKTNILSVSGLTPGVYFLRVTGIKTGEVRSSKLVIQ